MPGEAVVIVGAGVAGLAAAVRLSARGVPVTVLEKEQVVGGKIRQRATPAGPVDLGPTVFTMRWVFDALFDEAGESLEHCLAAEPLTRLAHHRWTDDSRLDLYANPERSRDAIGQFAGLQEARNFDQFRKASRDLHDALLEPFLKVEQPGLFGLIRGAGFSGLASLARTSPFRSMHTQLTHYFRDPRLLQLFGRYATYCGSSPYDSPASLILVAHVEQQGVWRIRGGMGQLGQALHRAAKKLGAHFQFGRAVERINTRQGAVSEVVLEGGDSVECSHLIVNADASALAHGLFGVAAAAACPLPSHSVRSLSAVTWSGLVEEDQMGPDHRQLDHHNVLFSADYPAEFKQIFGEQRIPANPTVYLCAPDRPFSTTAPPTSGERVFLLINAPAAGERVEITTAAWRQQAMRAAERQLSVCGIKLKLDADGFEMTTPADFHRRFPATGGALYGAATHGWRSAFARRGNRTRLPGLYLAGGSVHPGPGVPMAALSGLSAAAGILQELESRSSHWARRTAHG